MKSEWIKTTIGEYAPFTYGKGLKSDLREEGKIPVYGSNGQVDTHNECYVDTPGIIIGRKGSVGEVKLSNVPFWPIDTTFYVTKDDMEELWFTYYLLQSVGLNTMNSDSAVPGLNRDRAHSVEIKIPSNLQDRKKIGRFLHLFDQKIRLNKKINQTLEKISRSIFKSWFVDFDPINAKILANKEGHNPEQAAMAAITGVSLDQEWANIERDLEQKLSNMSHSQQVELKQTAAHFPDMMEDSDMGEIPKGWETKPLDEVADYLNGRAMQKYPPEEGKKTLPVLKISQLRSGDTSDADRASADIPERFKVYNGDMIFSWSGSLLIDLWCGGDAALNQHLFKVTSEDFEKWFYYLWTNHHLDNFIRIAEAKAVTMGHIKRSHLREAKCVIPTKEILNLGNKLIQPLLDKVIQLKLESKNLEELKETLLPRLISGEIEV